MMTEDEVKQTIAQLAEFAVKPRPAPILRTPKDYGMEYEDVFFPSMDGVPLEAWYIPAESNKLIIANHPMPMNRYGSPGHMEPWSQLSNFEVNFVKAYKHLHDAGYNVLAYDLRNHGNSGGANGGVCGIGMYEWRDAIGAMQYVKNHEKLSKMKVGLLSRCTGANASMIAMSKYPEYFKDIKCMVAPQPCSRADLMGQFAEISGIGDRKDELNSEIKKFGGFSLDEMSLHPYVKDIKVSVFYTQVHDDEWTKPEDVQTTYDLTPLNDKKLFGIEGTKRRFDGYNYFGKHPEQMIEWFNKYMG